MEAIEIIERIEKERNGIIDSVKKIDCLLKDLKTVPFESFNWIPVKTACREFDISQTFIYNKIDRGILNKRYLGSKMYVNKEEVERLMEGVGI